jgi:hypothetical protein
VVQRIDSSFLFFFREGYRNGGRELIKSSMREREREHETLSKKEGNLHRGIDSSPLNVTFLRV